MKSTINDSLKNDIIFCLIYGSVIALLTFLFEGTQGLMNPKTYLEPLIFSAMYLTYSYFSRKRKRKPKP